MPGQITRVELESHLLPTNQNVENVKRGLPREVNMGAEQLCHFSFRLSTSPESERLAWRHFVAEKRHHFDLFCFVVFVKVFHKRLLID
jgi:hypothetical protein